MLFSLRHVLVKASRERGFKEGNRNTVVVMQAPVYRKDAGEPKQLSRYPPVGSFK